MEIIKHQFQDSGFYTPDWTVQHLFIGTFNPLGGAKVSYYYGRKRNRTWELLSKIFNIEFNTSNADFLNQIKSKGIACVDLIGEVSAPEEIKNKILGQGYKDAIIINNKVKRKYNTDQILDVISKNKGVKVYSTWGKGSNILEWKSEVSRLGEIICLVSPSMAARVPKGRKKFEFMLRDWETKIQLITNKESQNS